MRVVLKKKAAQISELAIRSMLYEVSCFPSPGLVSPFDSGAHKDMDFYLFLKSISSLYHYIESCAVVGYSVDNADNILPKVRKIGIESEKRMFQVTGGINTQKGQIFLHGIIAASAGHILKRNRGFNAPEVCGTVAEICQGLIEKDFSNIQTKKKLTRGELLYLRYGLAGIRKEAEKGLPSVLGYGLPALLQAKAAGLSTNDTAAHVLLAIMCNCEDSNIAGKHSLQVLDEIQEEARKIIQCGGMTTPLGKEMILILHKDLSIRGISPGGAADLTAATFFVSFLEEELMRKE